MRKLRALLALSIIAGLAAPAFAGGVAAARKHRTRSLTKPLGKHAASTKFEPRQRSIDDERAAEIQYALIKAGYLSGSPSGHWDQDSITAMTKLQAANGWQTKLVPDSRALIKLGLGPSAAPASASADATASIGAPAFTAYAQ
jgi:hypothetical protein